MFTNVKIKTKLFLPIFILAIVFTVLTTSIIESHYSKRESLKSLKNAIVLATKLSKVLHETQKERGMSAGFITSEAQTFQTRLPLQREETDKILRDLTIFLKKTDISQSGKKINSVLNRALIELHKLSEIRDSINTLSISVNESITYYTNVNATILNTVIEISKISPLPNITQNIIAYSNFLYSKENAGIERAIGTAIITNDHIEKRRVLEFNSLLEKQSLYIEIFSKYASDRADDEYKKFLTQASIIEVNEIREIILHGKEIEILQIDPIFWFEHITAKIDKLKVLDDYLEKEILYNINTALNSTNNYFILFSILNVLSIILFIAMIIIVIQLLKSEKRLKILMDKYIISSTTDLKGKILDVSEAFCQISGYTKEELIGSPHNITRHKDMPKEAFKDMWQTIQSGETWQGKVKNRKKDGGYYWVFANIEPLFDKSGNIESYAAIRLDISSSEDLQEKIKEKDKVYKSQELEQKEHLNTVIESNNQAIIAIDDAKTILTYNSKAEKIFGFSKEEMIGTQNLLNIIPIQYKNLHTLASELFFKTGKSKGIIGSTLELEALHKEGHVFPIRISFETNKNEGKRIVVASVIDITQELEQDRILKQQSKLAQMGEMISMIAHQWRQPLNAISAASGVIKIKSQLNKLDKETAIDLSDKITEYSKHLSNTIDDFREFFKANKEKKETSYSEVVNSVMSIIEVSIINKNIEISKDFQCEEKFSTYQNELKQVVLNLIKNAEDVLIDNEISNPYIKISTYKDAESLILEVQDNAGGIPEEIIDNIFDPYFSTKTKKDGTGLGLYMSKTIIEEHCEGKLNVYNNEDGAVFQIILGNKNG